MELAKKYWWVIAIVIVILFLLLTTKSSKNGDKQGSGGNGSGCKPISYDQWKWKKQWYYDNNGGDWTMAHYQVLDEGYCEHID